MKVKTWCAVLLCMLVLLAAASCRTEPGGTSSTGGSSAPGSESPNPGQDAPEALAFADYEDVIDVYGTLLAMKQNGQNPVDFAYACAEEADKAIMEALCRIAAESEPAKMGYSTRDIGGDSSPELVLIETDQTVNALLSMKDGRPVLVDWFGSFRRRHAAIDGEGLLYIAAIGEFFGEDGVGMQSSCELRYLSEDGTLSGVAVVYELDENGEDIYTRILNGERSVISRSDYFSYMDMIFGGGVFDSETMTRNAGFRILPVLEPEETGLEKIPIDFSSYDAVLASFRSMVGVLPDYTREAWLNGRIDSRFDFPDDTAFAWYNQIFRMAYLYRPTDGDFPQTVFGANGQQAYGYALHDLNGDGSEELILMTEAYEIIAVFAMQDGKPVLLDDSSRKAECMITEDGELVMDFYDSRGTYYEYAIYAVADGGRLEQKVWLGRLFSNDYSNTVAPLFYSLENGEKVCISYDEYREIYQNYFKIKPITYTYEEYTKSVAGLTFVPLYGPVEVSDSYLGTWINYEIIDGKRFSITGIAEDAITLELKYHVVEAEGEPSSWAVLHAVAQRSGDGYVFEADGVRGRLEIGASVIWLTIEESEIPELQCRSYQFNSVTE